MLSFPTWDCLTFSSSKFLSFHVQCYHGKLHCLWLYAPHVEKHAVTQRRGQAERRMSTQKLKWDTSSKLTKAMWFVWFHIYSVGFLGCHLSPNLDTACWLPTSPYSLQSRKQCLLNRFYDPQICLFDNVYSSAGLDHEGAGCLRCRG